MNNFPKAAWNQNRTPPSANQPRPPIRTPRGRPPAPRTGQQTRNFKKPQARGQVYCLEAEEEESGDPHAVVSGIFTVNALPTKVLFDAGATHSFISPTTVKRMACTSKEMEVQLCATTPVGSSYKTNLIAWNCFITIRDRLFFADLVLLGIHGYDVILGMDWLTKYQATVDCKQKTLALVTLEGESLIYKGSCSNHTVSLISATKAYKLVGKGCIAYLCAIEVVETLELKHEDIPIVQEFSEVFQEVPGLPPDREIEFTIELVLGTTLISKAPYRIAPAELTELKKQL